MVTVRGRHILEVYAIKDTEEHKLLQPFGYRYAPIGRKAVYWMEQGHTRPSWQGVNKMGDWPSSAADDVFYEELYEYARKLQDQAKEIPW